MYSAESDFYCLARDKMSIPSSNELLFLLYTSKWSKKKKKKNKTKQNKTKTKKEKEKKN
jgi:hypothetical protein